MSTVGSGLAGLSALLSYHAVARIGVGLVRNLVKQAFEQLTQASGQLLRLEGRIRLLREAFARHGAAERI